jgi:hypothetical protein
MQILELVFCVLIGVGVILLWRPHGPGLAFPLLGWGLILLGSLAVIALNLVYRPNR